MRPVEIHLPRDFNASFTFFNEKGHFFPCPLHYHPEFEIVLVLKSTGQRYVGDSVSEFGPEDLVMMGPMLPHVWINDPEYLMPEYSGDADAWVIHFREDFLGDIFFNLPEMNAVKKIFSLSQRGISFKGNTKKKIIGIMKEMRDESNVQRLFSLLRIFSSLSDEKNFNILASTAYEVNTVNSESNRLEDVVKYVERNYSRDISIKEMASLSNLGLTTFCNLFKENYRKTFSNFLIETRIGHATELLLEGADENIAGIAYSCGYNSLANFNRQFRRIKGMTPSEFRGKFFKRHYVVSENFNTTASLKNKYNKERLQL